MSLPPLPCRLGDGEPIASAGDARIESEAGVRPERVLTCVVFRVARTRNGDPFGACWASRLLELRQSGSGQPAARARIGIFDISMPSGRPARCVDACALGSPREWSPADHGSAGLVGALVCREAEPRSARCCCRCVAALAPLAGSPLSPEILSRKL